MGITILGTGHYLPEYIASNQEYETFLDTSDEWIVTRTGMKERRIALDTPVWKMGVLAARQALKAAGISPEEIDLILCTTVTGDYRYPSTACLIQGELGANNAFAMDVAAACTGSVYALTRAVPETGDVKTVLQVSAEALPKPPIIPIGALPFCLDGAGAVVLQREKYSCPTLFSDPDQGQHLHCPFPAGFALWRRHSGRRKGSDLYELREVYKFKSGPCPLPYRLLVKSGNCSGGAGSYHPPSVQSADY